MKNIKTAEEILSGRFNTTPELLDHAAHCRVSSCLLAMEEYANQFKPEWVSVEERLPEGQQEVLVYLPKYGSTMAVYFLTDADPTGQTWFNPFWSTKRFDEVTHWMPLPQPPQK